MKILKNLGLAPTEINERKPLKMILPRKEN